MNNPYLVCSDRELRALPTQWLRAERWDKVGRLLDDIAFMEATVRRLGIDELLQAYAAALRVLLEEDWSSKLAATGRVLDRQAHHLLGWNARAQPAFFLQQLRNEAFQFGLDELQARAEAELARQRLLYLRKCEFVSTESQELVRTLQGHSGGVYGVALSVDGQLAVSASADKTLIVWDMTTGRKMRTLEGHTGAVLRVALSADGRLAISASEDQTLKVWDVAAGKELCTCRGHSDGVRGVGLSADGRLAVSASKDHTLRAWDISASLDTGVAMGHELGTLARDKYGYELAGVALSADGRLAVSASSGGTLTVWSISAPSNAEAVTARELGKLRWHDGSLNDVALSADGRLAISASEDKTLKVWDVAMCRELRTLAGHGKLVYGAALSSDGRLAVSTSDDRTLKVWDVATGHELRTLQGHNEGVRCVALSADGRQAVSGSADHTLKVWNILAEPSLGARVGFAGLHASMMQARETTGTGSTGKGHRAGVTDIALSADGQLAVSASNDNTLIVWSTATGRELRRLQGHTGGVLRVALSADGRRAVSVSEDQTLKVWDVAKGQELCTRAVERGKEHLYHVAINTDGLLTILPPDGRSVMKWKTASGSVKTKPFLTFSRWDDYVKFDPRSAGFSERDGIVKVWDTNGRELRRFFSHDDTGRGVTLSTDGRLAISELRQGFGRRLIVWEVNTRRELGTLGRDLKGHNPMGGKWALSASGRLAIALAEGERLEVWSVTTGLKLCTLQEHSEPVYDVALSADGQLAVSVSAGNSLRVWDISYSFDPHAATGQVVSSLVTDAPLRRCAMTPDGKTIIAGDSLGGVYVLQLFLNGRIKALETAQVRNSANTRWSRWRPWLKEVLGPLVR